MAPPQEQTRAHARAVGWQLSLFDCWRLRHGRTELDVHHREQRLIALLALQGSRPRGYVAGVLWPESTEHHAAGNLRAAVWRIEHAAPGLLSHDRTDLRLAPLLKLDVDAFTRRALRIIGWHHAGASVDRAAYLAVVPTLLRGDLLPGWYDDWVTYERARLAQLRLRALQLLADALVDLGEATDALIAASAAVSIEPLHEPAIRSLIRAEIENGDYSGAVRDYHAYRSRVLTELGVPPSSRLESLIQPLLQGQTSPPTRSVVA